MIQKLLLFCCLLWCQGAAWATKVELQHLHPAFWWAGMKHTELQILLHGNGVGTAEVQLRAEGIAISDIVRPENKNYLLLYVETEGAAPQTFHILLTKEGTTTKVPYELRSRSQQFRQTWDARDVMYLLLPDRFANGSTKNDVVKGALETTIDRTRATARHGGDIAGMIKHLDYWVDLGITAIAHTPIYSSNMPALSYTGEAATDYYEVDPRLGTNEEYVAFVATAQEKGLKVIMDIALNHCGTEHFLYKDRPADDWFTFDALYVPTNHRLTAVSDMHQDYQDRDLAQSGWRSPQLPEWNQRQPDVMTYLIQNTIWWIEYAAIDGIRQRDYPCMYLEPMSDWCRAIETEYPGFNVVGETPLTHAVGVSYWQKDSPLAQPKNSRLPSVTDFPLHRLLQTYYDEKGNDWEQGVGRLYHYLSQDKVYPNVERLLTFLSNDRTDRFAKTAGEAARFQRYRQSLGLLLTLRGQPQLYYGDEIGMYASLEEGAAAVQGDFLGGFPKDKVDAFTEKGRTEQQQRYFELTRRLLQWRKTTDAVAGNFFHVAPRNGVYYYVREGATKLAVVFVNGTDEVRRVSLSEYDETSKQRKAYEVVSGKEITLGGVLELAPRDIVILDLLNE